MKILIFYVLMCTNTECNTFEPMSWSVQSEDSIRLALDECSILSNAYEQLQAVKETDCYFEK